jgi:hypothetical protein
MEGMICTRMREIKKLYHIWEGMRVLPEHWAQGLILKLLEATHGQWNYKNIQINYSVVGTQATLQKEAIQLKIEEQMEVGAADLLEEDHWVMEVNLGNMETASGEQEKYWLVAIKTTQVAAMLARHCNQNCMVGLLRMGIKISHFRKSLCIQGWMAFSSQSYQGQLSLKESSPL